jgi:NAD+ kinase
MVVKDVLIFVNSTKPGAQELADDMRKFFSSKKISTTFVMLSSTEDDCSIHVFKADLAISLGGDGTVLTCAAALAKLQVPIMAVNLGTFGYITNTSANEYKEVFDDFVQDRYEPTERMMLQTKVQRAGKVVFEAIALNDMTIGACSMSKLVHLSLSIDGIKAAGLKSDGIIFATPMGSTAYSLAAGGPILDASMRAIIVNPICPFAMSVRPLVVHDRSVLRVDIPAQRTPIAISADGHGLFELQEGDVVTVQKSACSALFLVNDRRNSIEVLRDKLGWAGGFNA